MFTEVSHSDFDFFEILVKTNRNSISSQTAIKNLVRSKAHRLVLKKDFELGSLNLTIYLDLIS